jgi:protein-tyrosine phosphatase
MERVSKNLFVGDLQDAGSPGQHHRHGIESVVRLTHEDPEDGYPKHVEVYRYPLLDGPQHDPDTFQEAVFKTVELLESGSRVLVHCSAGASRSPTVAAAALTHHQETGFGEALEKVRETSSIKPHPALVETGEQVSYQD